MSFCPAHAEDTDGQSRKIASPTSAAATYFSRVNLEILSVTREGTPLGDLETYQYPGVTLLPVGALSALLGWPITVDQGNQTAQGFSPVTNGKLTIAPAINTILIGGDAHKLSENEIFFYNNDIYLDADILREKLGVKILINRNRSAAEISYTPYLPAPDHAAAPEVYGPFQHLARGAIAMPASVATQGDETLVLQIIVNDVPMVEFIDAQLKAGKIFLPVSSLTEMLEFPIRTDIEAMTAEGWFVREGNRFSLRGMDAMVKGKSYRIGETQVIRNDQDIYIIDDLLKEWFSLDFRVNHQKMELGIHSAVPFPFEDRLKREQLYSVLENRKRLAEEQKNYEPYMFPYKAISVPVIDVNMNAAYQRSADERVSAPYYIQGSGDLAYMTSRFYVSGDGNDHAVNDMRLSLGRESYKKGLLGPLNASSFRFGDINSIGVAQVSQTSEGSGVVVTNRDISRTDKFDVTSFTGDSTPGWDVELYRNNTLLETQTVGPDGRYEFNDIPILFGNNAFRILLLGPQGQLEEKVKTINASNSIIEPGHFTYNISADRKSERIVDFRDFEPAHPDGARVVSEFEYGISRWLTAAVGGVRTLLQDGEHRYATAGLRTSFLGILTSWDNAHDFSANGSSSRLTSFANYRDTNIRFTQKFARDFVSEEDSNITNPVKRETSLDVDRSFNLPLLGEFSTGLLLQRKVQENETVEKIIRNRFTKAFRGFNFTNTIEKNVTTDAEKRLFGSFAMRGLLGENLVGMNADYSLQPSRELSQLKLSWLRNFTPDVMNNFSISRLYGEDVVYKFEDAVTWDLDAYKLSFMGRYDTARDLYMGVTLNFSLGRYPDDQWRFSSRNLSEAGIVGTRSFLDSNFNLQRDDDEALLEGIPVKIGSRFYSSDENGISIAENLDTDRAAYIYADQKQFKDQTLGPGVEGYEADPRPGYPGIIEYPLFQTAQIEGYVEFPEDVTIPKRMTLELVNSEGQTVSTTPAEFDGYFLFTGVLPGSYLIKIPEDVLKNKNLSYTGQAPIVIATEDFITTGLKFEFANAGRPL